MRTAILWGFILVAGTLDKNGKEIPDSIVRLTGFILLICMAMDITEFILGVGW